eukprot:TRINITY_DN315_c0_g1_i3.p4 TRINITY_DN315_c0_g1~~TRINITY_DN315_c0_g1_i3.p4  ORF type:complete len:112 (-),score=3.41 TRINITY_DN315_c0_g1_i3:1439-1774(-)
MENCGISVTGPEESFRCFLLIGAKINRLPFPLYRVKLAYAPFLSNFEQIVTSGWGPNIQMASKDTKKTHHHDAQPDKGFTCKKTTTVTSQTDLNRNEQNNSLKYRATLKLY